MTTSTRDWLGADAEIEDVAGRMSDYLDIPGNVFRFSPDDLVWTALMIGPHSVRPAARLSNQTEEDRWVCAWDRVGAHLWSVLPSQEELSEMFEKHSRE